MPVQRNDDGSRSIQVEIEVPGDPEAVWRAIATAQGVSAWFVPTTEETDDQGVPTKFIANFGPGMDSVSTVTSWNPPHSFSADSPDLGPDAPNIATEWIVEAQAGGTCIVRVVHSLFTDADDWDKQLEGWESGWPSFFKILRLYVGHFAGAPSAAFQAMGFHDGPREDVWRTFLDAAGGPEFTEGAPFSASGDAPAFAGVTEVIGLPDHPEELLVRTETPAPGVGHIFAMKMGGRVVLSVRFFFYGDDAAPVAATAQEAWGGWIAQAFPATE